MEEQFLRNDYLEAVKQQSGWVYVRWVNNTAGRLSKSFIKTLKLVERKIKEQGLPGWFCGSEKEHTTMHGIIRKFGCEFVTEDDGELWFRKFIGG